MDFKKIYEQLSADFPSEAYSKDNSRGFDLTSLKAQYIVERLNQVLGIAGWRMTNSKFEADEHGVLYTGTLQLLEDNKVVHEVDAVGYQKFKEKGGVPGDSYKGARTDGLSKAASYIGLGNDMFKGLINPDGSRKSKSSTTAKVETMGSTKPAAITTVKKVELDAPQTAPVSASPFRRASVKSNGALSNGAVNGTSDDI